MLRRAILEADKSVLVMSLNDFGGNTEVTLSCVDVVEGCILSQTMFWTNQTASETRRVDL